MKSHFLAENQPTALPPSPNASRWPWAQIGLLSLNAGFYLSGLDDFVLLTGLEFPEAGQLLAGFLLLAGLILYVSSPKHRRGQEEVPYSEGMHGLNLAIFGAAMTMTLLSLVIPAIATAHKANQERQQAIEAERTSEAWQTIRSPKAPILMDIPSHWVESSDPSVQGNDVALVDVGNDLMFFLQSVPKEDVTYADLKAWADATLNQLKSSMEESEVIERATYVERGRSEMELCLAATAENTRMIIVMRFLEMPEHYVLARALTTSSGFRTHEEMLRRLVRSVRSE